MPIGAGRRRNRQARDRAHTQAQRHAVEEPETHRLVHRRPRDPGRDQMHLEGANVLQTEPIRGSAKAAREFRDGMHLGSLRDRRQIADRHILDHAPAKRAHLGHLIAPVLKIALPQPQSFKTEASPAKSVPPNAASAASFNPFDHECRQTLMVVECAVDVERLAIHIARVVAAQKCDGCGDVRRFS